MRLLDVATGTGLVARGAVEILGDPRDVVGVDPSGGMLREARTALSGPLVRGRGEALPFRDDTFDMLSMGFALRHVPDLEVAFGEYRRVLKPGGRVLLLEVSRPPSRVSRWLIQTHFQHVLPLLTRLSTGSEPAQLLIEVLLGHDRPVRAARDDPRRLAAKRLRRRGPAGVLRLPQRVRRRQARSIDAVARVRPARLSPDGEGFRIDAPQAVAPQKTQ